MKQKQPQESPLNTEEIQPARREFLQSAGKLAAYTPPLMLGLLMPGPHAIASGALPGNTNSGKKDKKDKKDKKEK